jgi:5'(3')-deoxyribonucleotidase
VTILLIDMDGVVADFDKAVRDYAMYNWGLPLHAHEQKDEFITNHPDLSEKQVSEIWDFINKPGFSERLELMDGAVEGVDKLSELCDIFFLTAPLIVSHNAGDKIAWAQKHFPDLARKTIITKHKHLVYGDIFIDDRLSNLDTWIRWQCDVCNNSAYAICYKHPWNPTNRYHRLTWDNGLVDNVIERIMVRR